MLLDNLNLGEVAVSELMNRKFIKVDIDIEIKKLIELVTHSDADKIVVISNNDKMEKIIGLLNSLDILKIMDLNISLKEYIRIKHKKVEYVLLSDDPIEKALDIILNKEVESIPVIENGQVVGIFSSNRLLERYNSSFCKNCNIINMLLDNIKDSIVVVDKNSIVRFWNKGSENLYKIPREEIVGKPVTLYFPNALLPKVIREKKPYEDVYNSPRKDTHIIISATPLFNGSQVVGAISSDRDISELINLSKNLNKTQHNLEILEQEISSLNENRFSFDKIVGEDPDFKETIRLCKSVSRSNINVLITGESGTGKEVFARAIHIESRRKGHFIPINCSAIPADLMESELFGYEGGAFTGALKKGKVGKFELAHNGTLFLDEIGDMPLHMQPKILRVLEDGVIYRVGSETSIKVDVRIIAATNRDLKKMVDEGKFRKDLYYRLNSIVVHLPPLRERKRDIPLLVYKFLRDFCMTYRTNMPTIPDEVMEVLMNYHWEGNIRELKNIVERIVILVKNNNAKRVEIDFLPNAIVQKSKYDSFDSKEELDLNIVTEAVEKRTIERALEIANGNKAKAAKILNIPRSTLYFKLEKYNLGNGD